MEKTKSRLKPSVALPTLCGRLWWNQTLISNVFHQHKRKSNKTNATNPASTEWKPRRLSKLSTFDTGMRWLVSLDAESHQKDEKENRETQIPAVNPQLRFPHFAGDCDGTKRWYQTSSTSTGETTWTGELEQNTGMLPMLISGPNRGILWLVKRRHRRKAPNQIRSIFQKFPPISSNWIGNYAYRRQVF